MEISTNKIENCIVVNVTGRVDSYTAPQLADELNSHTRNSFFNIVLDLSKVNYVSSAGLRVLIDTHKTCKRSGDGELLLVKVPPRIYETLDLAGFVPLFRFFSDTEKAITYFKS